MSFPQLNLSYYPYRYMTHTPNFSYREFQNYYTFKISLFIYFDVCACRAQRTFWELALSSLHVGVGCLFLFLKLQSPASLLYVLRLKLRLSGLTSSPAESSPSTFHYTLAEAGDLCVLVSYHYRLQDSLTSSAWIDAAGLSSPRSLCTFHSLFPAVLF